MLRGKLVLFGLMVCFGFVTPAHADDLSTDMLSTDVIGAVDLGRAGVSRADGTDVASFGENIAAISLGDTYAVFAGAGLGASSAYGLHAGAVDAQTSAVAFGLRYVRLSDQPALTGDDLPGWKVPGDTLENPTTHQGVHAGLALPLIDTQLALGVTGRYDWRSSTLGGKEHAINMGVSAAWRPVETVTLAAGADNLLQNDYPDTARSLGAGVRWAPGDYLGLELDMQSPWDQRVGFAEWGLGADLGLNEWLVLRAGVETTWAVAGGLALQGDNASLNYGARFPLGETSTGWHGLDLRIFF